MRSLIVIAFFFLFCSCSKDKGFRSRNENRTDFFRGSADAIAKVQKFVSGFDETETVISIQGVSYIDSKDKSYAFVFYSSDKGEGNLVIRQDYQDDELVASHGVRCQGEDCSCKVKSLITSDGTVYLDCNCTSCSMIIH